MFEPVILVGDINKTVVAILQLKGYECWVQSERVMTLFATPDKKTTHVGDRFPDYGQ